MFMIKDFMKYRNKFGIKKGDSVVVISGSDKGKKGVVKSVFPKFGTVLVEGINISKRAVKPDRNNNQNFLKRERPVNRSKVRIVKSSGAPAKKIVKSVKKG